jgi:hypothetical protein
VHADETGYREQRLASYTSAQHSDALVRVTDDGTPVTKVLRDVAVESASRASIRPEVRKLSLPIWSLEVHAVVAQEDSVSISRIIVSNEVLWLDRRELDSAAQ